MRILLSPTATLAVALSLWLTVSPAAARMAPSGHISFVHTSKNNRFAVKAVVPSTLMVTDGDIVLWRNPFLDVSNAAISDDGSIVAVTLWGWKDEGASSGIEFYNGSGQKLGKDEFGGPFAGTDKKWMKWVQLLLLSADGGLCALGESGRDQARVTLYDTRTAKFLWERSVGLDELGEVAFSPSGRHILVATRGRESEAMVYVLLDAGGAVVWEKNYERNPAPDVNELCRFTPDGQSYEVYVDAEKEYVTFPLPEGK